MADHGTHVCGSILGYAGSLGPENRNVMMSMNRVCLKDKSRGFFKNKMQSLWQIFLRVIGLILLKFSDLFLFFHRNTRVLPMKQK